MVIGRVVCAALLALWTAAAGAQSGRAVAPVSFTAATLAGDTVRIGQGRPAVVAVFATWCTTCRTEFAELNALAREHGAHVTVVALSVDQARTESVRRFAAARQATFPVVHDSGGTLSKRFGVIGVPETYLVTGDGRIVWSARGPVSARSAELTAAIGRLIGAGQAR